MDVNLMIPPETRLFHLPSDFALHNPVDGIAVCKEIKTEEVWRSQRHSPHAFESPLCLVREAARQLERGLQIK
jgi:hypothetical protein